MTYQFRKIDGQWQRTDNGFTWKTLHVTFVTNPHGRHAPKIPRWKWKK